MEINIMAAGGAQNISMMKTFATCREARGRLVKLDDGSGIHASEDRQPVVKGSRKVRWRVEEANVDNESVPTENGGAENDY